MAPVAALNAANPDVYPRKRLYVRTTGMRTSIKPAPTRDNGQHGAEPDAIADGAGYR